MISAIISRCLMFTQIVKKYHFCCVAFHGKYPNFVQLFFARDVMADFWVDLLLCVNFKSFIIVKNLVKCRMRMKQHMKVRLSLTCSNYLQISLLIICLHSCYVIPDFRICQGGSWQVRPKKLSVSITSVKCQQIFSKTFFSESWC